MPPSIDPILEAQLAAIIERGVGGGVMEVGGPFAGDAAARLAAVVDGPPPEQYAALLQMVSWVRVDGETWYGFDQPDGWLDIDERNRDRRALGRVLPRDALVFFESTCRDVYLLRAGRSEKHPTSPIVRIDPEVMEMSFEAASVVEFLRGLVEES